MQFNVSERRVYSRPSIVRLCIFMRFCRASLLARARLFQPFMLSNCCRYDGFAKMCIYAVWCARILFPLPNKCPFFACSITYIFCVSLTIYSARLVGCGAQQKLVLSSFIARVESRTRIDSA